MAPVTTAIQSNGATKTKRPAPPGIQTNGIPSSSPSPLMSAKKPSPSAKPITISANDRTITASTVRPVSRTRREASSQAVGRNSRNSAGLRLGFGVMDSSAQDDEPPPYGMLYFPQGRVRCRANLLKLFPIHTFSRSMLEGRPPSLFICTRRIFDSMAKTACSRTNRP